MHFTAVHSYNLKQMVEIQEIINLLYSQTFESFVSVLKFNIFIGVV